jgi:hypothetical protein
MQVQKSIHILELTFSLWRENYTVQQNTEQIPPTRVSQFVRSERKI